MAFPIPSWTPHPDECIDALLWIGPSYKGFLCGPGPSCAVPFVWDRQPCFVHEAEWRGISRRIPAFPRWAIPGRTRVFLGRGGGGPRGSGRIFGYFVLARTEVMVAGPGMTAESGPGGLISGDAERVRKEHCWDNTEITTHTFVDGQWVRTDKECPPLPDCECLDGEEKTVHCADGSVITVAVCVDGRWRLTGEQCPKPQSVRCERFKPPRNCPTQDPDTQGLRTTPGAVYLVDLLEAAITDEFCERLHEAGIPDAFRQPGVGNPSGGPEGALSKAHRLFVDVAGEAAQALRGSLVLPEELTGIADFRGSLVLFRKPPLCEVSPRSGFRCLGHIDGTWLMEQILAGEPRVLVCFCKNPGKNSMTKDEIAGHLACQVQVTQRLAQRFLDALVDLAESELAARGVFRLWGLGTFRAGEIRGRAMTKKATVAHLAGAIGRRPAQAGKLLDGLTVLVRDQIASGRDFWFPNLGTFHPIKSGLRFQVAKKMENLGADLTLSTQL